MKSLQQIKDEFKNDTFAVSNNIDIVSVTEECSVVAVDVNANQRNALKAVQGGLIYTLADFAFAVHANRSDTVSVTQSASISYLSPALGDKLFATATPIKAGKKTCTYNILVHDEKNRAIATVLLNGFNIN